MSRILIVDDDEQIRRLLRVTMERAGYVADEASDGKKALDLVRVRPPDLAVIDIVMPEKEGLETIMEIRRDSPEMKIIAISGGGSFSPQVYLDFARDLGANRVFNKPIDRQELLKAVQELLTQPETTQ